MEAGVDDLFDMQTKERVSQSSNPLVQSKYSLSHLANPPKLNCKRLVAKATSNLKKRIYNLQLHPKLVLWSTLGEKGFGPAFLNYESAMHSFYACFHTLEETILLY